MASVVWDTCELVVMCGDKELVGVTMNSRLLTGAWVGCTVKDVKSVNEQFASVIRASLGIDSSIVISSFCSGKETETIKHE